jgi:hypothetical protein
MSASLVVNLQSTFFSHSFRFSSIPEIFFFERLTPLEPATEALLLEGHKLSRGDFEPGSVFRRILKLNLAGQIPIFPWPVLLVRRAYRMGI